MTTAENHTKEVMRILKEQKCMNDKGQIRAWKPTAWPAINTAGHSSLDPDKCACKHGTTLKEMGGPAI